MRVAFWTELYSPAIGGVETIVGLLAEELVRRGHEALVITNREPGHLAGSECIRGVTVRRFDATRAVTRKDLRLLRDECASILALRRSFNAAVEHVHSTGPMLVPYEMVRRDFNTPTVTSMHCLHDLVPSLVRAGGAFVRHISQSRAVLTPSELLRNCLVRAVPELKERVHFEPYGLSMPRALVSRLSFEPPVVLCLGRLVREKGFDVALNALARVHADGPSLRAIIAGDGPERSALQRLARELEIEPVVEFVGWVPPSEVPALINRASIVLIRSRWQEPAALVTLESALMGRPVIATAVGGVVELVQHGETGLLVENENVEAMAQAMQSLLANPDQARLLGENACRRARARYTFDRYFERHVELYREAAAAAAV